MTVVASKFERKQNDLYETEPWAIGALLSHISRPIQVWEPSAGNHALSNELKAHGIETYTSDIAVYNQEHDFMFDFLKPDQPHPLGKKCEWIITNPPFGKGNRDAVKYAELALERAENVALLLTAKFDFGKTRAHLFEHSDRFNLKIALTDRIRWFEGGHIGTEDHAWYVWSSSACYGPFLAWSGKCEKA